MFAKNSFKLVFLFLICAFDWQLVSSERGSSLVSLRRVKDKESENADYDEEPETTGEDMGEEPEEESEEDYDYEEPTERECEFSEDSDEIEFECKAKTENMENEIEDEIDFKIETSKDGIKIKVKYEQEIETADNETETETQYEIVFDTIVEYEKASNETMDQSFEWGVDPVLQQLKLTEWQPFSAVTTDDEGIVSRFSVTTLDEIVTFAFTLSRANLNEALTANKIKVDFRLTNFPWIGTGDSFVALFSTIESQKEVEVEYDEDESDEDEEEEAPEEESTSKTAKDIIITFDEAVDGTGVMPFGEYTWATTAEVNVIDFNGTNTSVAESRSLNVIEVVATTPPLLGDETFQSIAFSFVGDLASGASDIYWDPEAGISYAREVTTIDPVDPTSAAIHVGSLLGSAVGVLSSMVFLAL